MRRGLLATVVGLLLAVLVVATLADEPPAPREIRLRLVDPTDGRPLAGGTVAVRGAGGEYGEPVSVDAHGEATVTWRGPGRSYASFLCRAAGRVPTAVSWDAPNDQPIDLPKAFTVPMPAGRTLAGRVVDDAGRPVAGAALFVQFFPPSRPGDSPHVTPRIRDERITSAADGTWRWDGAPAEHVAELTWRVEHPDFVAGPLPNAPPAEKLLAGEGVFTLDRGVTVRGWVTGPDSRPIGGATVVSIEHVHVVNDYGATTATDADGWFELSRQRAGQTLPVTVRADGFAPDLLRVEVKPDLPPLDVRLTPGRTLRLRVQDPTGRPIEGAAVNLTEWRSVRSLNWSGTTDAEGRVDMPHAPADAMHFAVSRDGYRYVIRAPAGGGGANEAVLTLKPQVKLTGTVVDAATRRPIERFSVVPGAALWEHSPPSFDFDRRHDLSGGRFELPIDAHDEVVAAYVRVEAPGYRPAVSRPLVGDETQAFELAPAGDVTGTVTGADGKPATDAEVMLVLSGDQVNSHNGRIDRFEGQRARTDGDGRFRFPPQADRFWVMVLRADDYAVVPVDAGTESVDVKLSAWARLEGVFRPAGRTAGETGLGFSLNELYDPRANAPRFLWSYAATTDGSGQYQVDRVPHLNGDPASVLVYAAADEANNGRWLPVRMNPGETTTVSVDGMTGRTVTGRVAAASAVEALASPRGSVLLVRRFDRPATEWPSDLRDAAAEMRPVYRAQVSGDGSFTITDVPPGAYDFAVTMYSTAAWGATSGRVDVPAGDLEQPVEVGTLHYAPQGGLTAGAAAPDAWGQTLDGRPIRGGDFAGRSVVVAVWDSCTGRADPHLPHLERLAERFGGDPRVALLSVNTDPIACGFVGVPKRPATLRHEAWVRGHLSLAEQALLTRIGGEKWPAILIVGRDGKLVARDLTGETVGAALEQHLAQSGE